MDKLRHLTGAIRFICAILMAVITGATFLQVIRRYIFGSVFRWPEELAIFSMIWVAFLGAVLCLQNKEHIRIDFFIGLLPASVRKWVEVLGLFICFGFMMLLASYAPGVITSTGVVLTPALRVPMYVVYGSVLVSAALMTPYFIVLIHDKIKEDTKGGGA
ncbi:MAG: TRAP transporter small permease [Defluviitaleaceae bacterium]|nr:TRAP transporter small permease [Defluviitaleaceae bacterium]